MEALLNVGLLEDVKLYSSLGWALTKLDGKNPIGYGWEKTKPVSPETAGDIWKGWEGNVGLVLGTSGVIDFELDSGNEDHFFVLATEGPHVIGYPPTPSYITGSGKPHILFKDPGGLSRRSRDGFELRAGNHQSVLPPSIHPETGGAYEWVKHPDFFALQDPPQRLLDFFNSPDARETSSNWREALRGQKLSVGEGRHSSLISYLGLAVNHFETVEQLVGAAIAYASVTQDPPYSDEEIEERAHDIWRRYREEPSAEEAVEHLKLVSADKIRMRSVRFLWRPFLQSSAFHLLVGRKGAGKGSVLAWLAAQMTVGFEDHPPRAVLWIATEDSFEIDVKPRFIAQGGVEEMLLCVQQSIHLPEDLAAIKAICGKYGVGMVVIDPLGGVIGAVDSNSEGPIVAAIGGLNDLADKLDLAVIGVRHLGKNIDKGALDAVLGNVAWVNTPRAVLGIAQDEEEKVITLQVLAGNRVRGNASFDFDLNEHLVKGVEEAVSKVIPKGASWKTMDEILARKREPQRPAVKAWLEELMADNTPLNKESLAPECLEKFGVGLSTIQKACAELKEEGKLRYLPKGEGDDGRWYFVKV